MQRKVSYSDLTASSWTFLGLGFGSGLAPKAPGTAGTLAAIPLFLLMAYLLPLWGYAMVVIVAIFIGIPICEKSARQLDCHDHPAIVWDEIAGYLVAMLGVAVSIETVILAFVLFRFFDIVKPWPIRLLDHHVHGGVGIMLDDIIAGIFTNISMHVLIYFFCSAGCQGINMPLYSLILS